MSNENLARRTRPIIEFDGVDITGTILPYLLSVTYTDNEEYEADDLTIKLQDRESLWLEDWLEQAIKGAAASKLKIRCTFIRENWTGGGADEPLPCGEFELCSVKASGPPATVTIKATSLPFSGQMRRDKKNKAWESYTLSGIADELAGSNGLSCMYEASTDPFYKRREQSKTTDIDFLIDLCKDAGISLKATDGMLVLFDQKEYEARPHVLTIRRGNGVYTQYALNTGAADSQYSSCRVRYAEPKTGKCIQGIAKTEDYNEDEATNQQLEIHAKVESGAEAKALAEKNLRLHNKFNRTASFTLPGNPYLVSGVTVLLEHWGGWNGKYITRKAVHTVSSTGGYTTKIELRRVLAGY